jgi:TPP-dependent pyruvate/acetoin dehydrogenase alpha subunit
MPRGSPAVKLAITVDRAVHARIVDAAEAEGSSVSAWMTEAARRALLLRDGLAAVREWETAHGILTEAELEAARQRVAVSVASPERLREALPKAAPSKARRKRST